MKNRQVIEIHEALQRLEGTPSGMPPGSVIPYRFPGNVVYAIAKNINKTAIIYKDLQYTHQRLLKSLLNPGETGLKKGDPRIEAMNEEYEKVMEMESDYIPHKFQYSGLNIGTGQSENQISPGVVCALDPLFIQDP